MIHVEDDIDDDEEENDMTVQPETNPVEAKEIQRQIFEWFLIKKTNAPDNRCLFSIMTVIKPSNIPRETSAKH